MDNQELGDRIAIREVIERYSDAVTRRAWADLGEMFHEAAVWSVGAPFNLEFRTRGDIEAGLQAAVGAMPFLVQMTHSVVIDLHGDHATARTVVNEVARGAGQETGLYLLGIYNDTLSRQEGRWRFERRHFEPLFLDSSPLAGMAFPPGASPAA